MSDFCIGDRVRVIKARKSRRAGQHATVSSTECGAASITFDTDGLTMYFDDEELESITPRILRQDAASAVARTEALLAQQRAALRAAWVAEIVAMPVVAHATGFEEADVILQALPGAQDVGYGAGWTSRDGYARLAAGLDRSLFVDANARDDDAEFPIVDGNLDAAVKGALCWLAERDVFLLDRNDSERTDP